MAIAAGVNCITKYEDRLASAIAACQGFKDWTGLTDASSRVHVYTLPDPLDDAYSRQQWTDMHPLALVGYPEDGNNIVLTRDSGPEGFTVGYQYQIDFECMAEPVGWPEQIRRITNPVGSIVENLVHEVARQFNLGIDSVEPIDVPSTGARNVAGTEMGGVVWWKWMLTYRFEV